MILGENTTIDLVVAGPNEGGNTGPWLFTLSGTMGATYTSVYRGVNLLPAHLTHQNVVY